MKPISDKIPIWKLKEIVSKILPVPDDEPEDSESFKIIIDAKNKLNQINNSNKRKGVKCG